jgi:hypothetical protein
MPIAIPELVCDVGCNPQAELSRNTLANKLDKKHLFLRKLTFKPRTQVNSVLRPTASKDVTVYAECWPPFLRLLFATNTEEAGEASPAKTQKTLPSRTKLPGSEVCAAGEVMLRIKEKI